MLLSFIKRTFISYRNCIIFVLILFFTNRCYPQIKPFEFNLIAVNKDISVGKVTGITQDKFGYMWFVDQEHHQLIRYDGYRMKVFKSNPSDTNSLKASGFECIAADSLGNVWFPVNNGVDKINSPTGVITHYKLRSGSNAILVDHLGYIWLGTFAGLCRLDPKTGEAIYYSHNDNDSTTISSNLIRVIYEDHEGTIWIGNGLPFTLDKDGGLNKFNRTTGKFTRYMHDPNNPQSIINDKVRAILEDSKGIFWIGTQGDGLQIMDRKTGTFKRLTYDPAHPEKLSRPPIAKGDLIDHITFINEDQSGAIWIGAYHQGITRYDPFTKKTTHFIGDKSSPKSFNDSTTWCAFTSNDGTLWIATETSNSLYSVDAYRKNISSISVGQTASSFAEDKDGYLWVATEGNGIFKLDQDNNILQNFKHSAKDTSSIADDHLMIGLLRNGQNKIWAASYFGIRILDILSNKVYRFSNNEMFKDFKSGGVVDVIEDTDGIAWLACWQHGLIRYDPKNNSAKQFLPDPKDSFSISSNFLNHLIEDKGGRLWIIGQGGINRLDRKTNRFKHYLPETFIGSIYQDSKKTIWAGTEKGLFLYDEKKDIFLPFFETSSPLYSLPIGNIVEDNDDNLWFATNSTIDKLNLVTKQVFIYGEKFGVPKNSLAPYEKSYKNKKGQLLIGYGDGFFIFYPEELNTKTNFKIVLTDLLINSNTLSGNKNNVIEKPVEEINELTLKYNQNNIVFNFSAMDYRDPESIQYFTMLEGYDDIWRAAKDEKAARYFNLPRGKFTYCVKAINKDGVMTEKKISIIINPPWWQTWWAYSLYALLLGLAIWFFIKWRTKTLLKEKNNLESRVALRTKELKEEKEIVESTLAELKSTQTQLIQSEKMASLGEMTAGIAHEIQNPLNFVNNFSEVSNELLEEMKGELITGNTQSAMEIADDVKQNLEKILHHGKRADAIVKSMLQHSRTSSGLKESTNINALCDEYIRLAYHGLRAKDKSFNAKFETQFDDNAGEINIIAQDIGRVILNLINNAFYAVTEKSKQNIPGYQPIVVISTKKEKDKIEMRVEDNGNGIPQQILDKIFQPFFTTKPTGQGTGLGLSLSYDIIKAHNGELKVQTTHGEGSTFIILLPVSPV